MAPADMPPSSTSQKRKRQMEKRRRGRRSPSPCPAPGPGGPPAPPAPMEEDIPSATDEKSALTGSVDTSGSYADPLRCANFSSCLRSADLQEDDPLRLVGVEAAQGRRVEQERSGDDP